MVKNILFFLVFSIFSSASMKGQPGKSGHPAKHADWELSTKKINDCEYDLVFTVHLEKDWHTFSIVKIPGAEQEVFPTQITFKPNSEYTLVGKLSETKPKSEYDETIKKTVYVHYDKVVFTQRVKLHSSNNVKISGKYEYQVCKDVCQAPPHEKFDFELKGTPACKR